MIKYKDSSKRSFLFFSSVIICCTSRFFGDDFLRWCTYKSSTIWLHWWYGLFSSYMIFAKYHERFKDYISLSVKIAVTHRSSRELYMICLSLHYYRKRDCLNSYYLNDVSRNNCQSDSASLVEIMEFFTWWAPSNMICTYDDAGFSSSYMT